MVTDLPERQICPAELNVPLPPAFTRRRFSSWVPLIVVAALLGPADVLVAPLMDEISPHDWAAPFVYACFGLIAAQVALLHVGVVFGNEPFWLRLLIAWACGGILFVAWFAGFEFSLGRSPFPTSLLENLLRVLCSLPIISLAIQLPLWLARVGFGWRFYGSSNLTAGSTDSHVSKNQLTIRDLLFATGFVALTLGIARFAPQPTRDGAMRPDFWIGLALFGGGAVAASLIVVVPLLWIFARCRSLAACWGLTMLYAFTAEFIGVFIATLLRWGGRMDAFDILGYSTTVFCLAAGIASGLTLCRRAGYELQWRLE